MRDFVALYFQYYERGLWWCMWGGNGVCLLFTLLRNPLGRLASTPHPRNLPRHLAFLVFTRLYIAVFAVACIAQWRGTWHLIDIYCGQSLQLALFSLGLGGATLARLKALRNLSGPPCSVAPDLKDNIFGFGTRFGKVRKQ